jgi:HAMP domain-containing protein
VNHTYISRTADAVGLLLLAVIALFAWWRAG